MTTKILQTFLLIFLIGIFVLTVDSSQAANLNARVKGKLIGSENLGFHFLKASEQLVLDGRNFIDRENPEPARDVFTLIEKQSITLPEDIYVWKRFFRKETQEKPDVLIPANTVVSSYLFYFNPPGTQKYSWTGQIEFEEEILGIIAPEATEVDTQSTAPSSSPLVYWEPTNSLLGLEDTEYVIRTWLDWYEDTVVYDSNILFFDVTSKRGYEPFRVITRANANNVSKLNETYPTM